MTRSRIKHVGMFIAETKSKVKVLGSFSDYITKFPISCFWLCAKVKKSLVIKGGMRKKVRNVNRLLRNIPM